MLKRLLFFILLMNWTAPIQGQIAVQDQLTFDERGGTYDLNRRLWFFEDAGRSFSDSDLGSPEFHARFAPLTKKTPNFGFSESDWWARIPLRNLNEQPRAFHMTEGYALVDQIDVWLLDSSGRILQHEVAGDKIEAEHQEVSYRLPTFKLTVPSGDSTLMIRIKSQGSVIFDIDLHSEVNFHEQKTTEYSFLYTMFGILGVMALYNFFMWIHLRRITFLLYIGFILTVIGQFMIVTGLVTHHLKATAWLMNDGYLLIANSTTLMALLFPIFFLSLPKRHPWLMRFSMLGLILILATTVASFFSYNTGAKLSVFGGLLASVFALSCGIVCSLKRFRPAYFFTLAWSVIIVANLLRMAMLTGSMPATFVVEWGVLMGSVVEVVLLSLAIADKMRVTERVAFERIEHLNEDLQREHDKVLGLKNNLERLVDEQTREIRSILKHIQIGIVAVRKPGLLITETHSDCVKNIFDTDEVAQRSIVELLFHGAAATREMKSQVQNALESCLDEEGIAFDMNSHLLPSELVYHREEFERILQLDWNPVLDHQGRTEKILVIMKDVTALKKLERETAEKSKELELIGEILDVPPRQFSIFMSTSHSLLAECTRLLKVNPAWDREVLKILFINMHTIKGSARALQLKNLTPKIHELEQTLAAMMKKDSPWNRDVLLAATDHIQGLVDHYQELNQGKLGRDSADAVQLPLRFIGRLHQTLQRVEQEVPAGLKVQVKPFRETLEDLTFVRAETVFREVLSHAEMLARDLRKECPDIIIQDHSIRLSTEGQDFVRKAFLHIIRNSMDHGIETPAERVKMGKAEKGRIEVSVSMEEDRLSIRYRDDGRGLNVRAIRRLAQERGLIQKSSAMTLEDIAYCIFEPGFSTSAELSDISGRGVGMNAVKEYVEKGKGTVALRLLSKDVIDPEFVSFELILTLNEQFCAGQAA
ncbi:MAG TPA: 7TM diverse intracellular signaling domain-containing protein [Oligoflexus sp.]|uniref:7TM diverse intracellular signaling domain-containing protein n=1 Tax=Oligoflexus sp. TaxID=1971216 RepID=UPI002D7EF7B1|nr:7TM diverse intracellular signaling domain-containing protein [Oligoflexus sp.]HET9236909.1 7TM diverse intracellular signaling domain-containing protein [Oligoflexus sp.]